MWRMLSAGCKMSPKADADELNLLAFALADMWVGVDGRVQQATRDCPVAVVDYACVRVQIEPGPRFQVICHAHVDRKHAQAIVRQLLSVCLYVDPNKEG